MLSKNKTNTFKRIPEKVFPILWVSSSYLTTLLLLQTSLMQLWPSWEMIFKPNILKYAGRMLLWIREVSLKQKIIHLHVPSPWGVSSELLCSEGSPLGFAALQRNLGSSSSWICFWSQCHFWRANLQSVSHWPLLPTALDPPHRDSSFQKGENHET